MAKQTIIVMSDSHGDRAIVEEIRNHYIGKVDAIFITETLSFLLMMRYGKGFRLLQGIWTFTTAIQNA